MFPQADPHSTSSLQITFNPIPTSLATTTADAAQKDSSYTCTAADPPTSHLCWWGYFLIWISEVDL